MENVLGKGTLLAPGSRLNALDLLTARLFDYAGTFPPASLPFKQALASSARAGLLARPSILGADMVVDSPDLKLMTARAVEQAGFGDTQCSLALVGVPVDALKRTVPRVAKFNDKNAGLARIDSLEVHGNKLRSDVLQEHQRALGQVRLFVEPTMGDRAWPNSGAGLLQMLGRLRRAATPVGLKVRGSGPNAISNASLAYLIPEVVANGIPFKATAGLHHPILEMEHGNAIGFLNLAAAIRLRQVLGESFGSDAILACLQESRPDAYSFEGELAWRGRAARLDEVARAMDELHVSIGTCSLAEPDDDMVRLFGEP